MATVIYGASDDLIEVEGDVRGEATASYGAEDRAGDLLVCSDGTLLAILFDSDGVWRIKPHVKGPLFDSVDQAPVNDESNYSDRASLRDGLKWVYVCRGEWIRLG